MQYIKEHRPELHGRFPVEYPEKAPRLKCLTPMYHCNIDRNGSVCLDMDHELLQLKVAGPDPEVEQSSRSSAYCIVQALLSLHQPRADA
eukprot:g18605.t1